MLRIVSNHLRIEDLNIYFDFGCSFLEQNYKIFKIEPSNETDQNINLYSCEFGAYLC